MALAPSTAIQRPDLGLALEEFDLEASRNGFIGLKVFPILSVALATANFSRLELKSLLKSSDTSRAPGAAYSRGQGTFIQDFYATKEQGHEEAIDDNEAAIYAYTIDSERYAAQTCRDVVLRNAEKRVAVQTQDTINVATTPVGNAWNDYVNSTPIADVKTGIGNVRAGFGVKPNTLILSWTKFKDLRDHPQVIDRIKYSGRDDPKNVTTQVLAEIFDLEQVLVADAQYNSANEAQPAALHDIWDPTIATLAKIAKTNNLREVCFGRTFHFDGDGSSIGGAVEMYRDEKVRGNVVRVRMQTHEKQINAQCARQLTGV